MTIPVNKTWHKGILHCVNTALESKPTLFIDFIDANHKELKPNEIEAAKGTFIYRISKTIAFDILLESKAILEGTFCPSNPSEWAKQFMSASTHHVEEELLDRLVLLQRRAFEKLLVLIALGDAKILGHSECCLYHVHLELTIAIEQLRLQINDYKEFYDCTNDALVAKKAGCERRLSLLETAIDKSKCIWTLNTKAFYIAVLKSNQTKDIELDALGVSYAEVFGSSSQRVHFEVASRMDKRELIFAIQESMDRAVLLALCIIFRIEESMSKSAAGGIPAVQTLYSLVTSAVSGVTANARLGAAQKGDIVFVTHNSMLAAGKVIAEKSAANWQGKSYKIRNLTNNDQDWFPSSEVRLFLPSNEEARFLTDVQAIAPHIGCIESAITFLNTDLVNGQLIWKELQAHDPVISSFVEIGHKV